MISRWEHRQSVRGDERSLIGGTLPVDGLDREVACLFREDRRKIGWPITALHVSARESSLAARWMDL